MAGMGPPPSENKRRRNKDEYAEYGADLDPDVKVEAPELPGASQFSQRTRDWYATWCGSLQAGAFTSTDWSRLHMLAYVVEEFFSAETASLRAKLMGEIRQNESLLGATHVDRMRGRMKTDKPAAPTTSEAPLPDGVADMTAKRRQRMADAS